MSAPEKPTTKTLLPAVNPRVMGFEANVSVATFAVTDAPVVTSPLPGQTVARPETATSPPAGKGFTKKVS